MKLWIKITSIVAWIFLLLTFVSLFLISGVKLFGYYSYNVEQNNMMPVMSEGSLGVCKVVDNEQYAEGDVVAFMTTISTGLDTGSDRVFERIIQVDQNAATVTTQSDNLESPRGSIMASGTPSVETTAMSSLEGKMFFSIPVLGYLSIGLKNVFVDIVLILWLAVLVFFAILPIRYKAPRQKKKQVVNYGDDLKLRGTDGTNRA